MAIDDHQQGAKWIRHYSSSHRILLVGEGDFSFALCLAKAFGSANNITATSLDPKNKLRSKYPKARKNVRKLKRLGCTVLHGVDVRTMSNHSDLMLQTFDRIVFNFPHAGFYLEEHRSYQIARHQLLVSDFFNSAFMMLRSFGEVHVTHKTTHPFSRWRIEDLAKEVGLILFEEVNFRKRHYPGYVNKRGDGKASNTSFHVGRCSTFKFQRAWLGVVSSVF